MPTIDERILESGKRKYRARVRLSGFPPKTKTFDKKRDAFAWGVKKEEEMRDGRFSPDLQARRRTVGEMIDRYLDNIIDNKTVKVRYIDNQKAQLNWWKKEIGDFNLSNINSGVISEARDKLAGKKFRKRKPGTVNRYLAALSHVFSVAVKEWGWIKENPVGNITKAREPKGRERFLDKEERKRLLDACAKVKTGKPLLLVVMLALGTAARKGEIIGAEIQNFNYEQSTLTVYDTKNGEPRMLYVSGRAKEMLKAFIDNGSRKRGKIFVNRKGKLINIDKEFALAKEMAGLGDFRFHDLRHSAASELAAMSASLVEISEVLGHKSHNMVKRYAHLNKSQTEGLVMRMNERMFEEMEMVVE